MFVFLHCVLASSQAAKCDISQQEAGRISGLCFEVFVGTSSGNCALAPSWNTLTLVVTHGPASVLACFLPCIPTGASSRILRGISSGALAGISFGMYSDAPSIESPKVCQKKTQQKTITLDRVPEDMPNRMPERMPKDMRSRVPEDVPDRESMPNRALEWMPDGMAGRMPHRNLERYLVIIVRTRAAVDHLAGEERKNKTTKQTHTHTR